MFQWEQCQPQDAKRALLKQLNSGTLTRQDLGAELLKLYDSVSIRDSDPEAKRLLAPLMNTVVVLLAQERTRLETFELSLVIPILLHQLGILYPSHPNLT